MICILVLGGLLLSFGNTATARATAGSDQQHLRRANHSYPFAAPD